MAKQIGKPSNAMRDAVNASIAGNKAKATKLLREHSLSRKELQERLDIRDGQRYPKPPARRARARVHKDANTDQILSVVDAKTRVMTLVRLERWVQELLSQKSKAEVNKARRLLADLAAHERRYLDAKARLGL